MKKLAAANIPPFAGYKEEDLRKLSNSKLEEQQALMIKKLQQKGEHTVGGLSEKDCTGKDSRDDYSSDEGRPQRKKGRTA